MDRISNISTSVPKQTVLLFKYLNFCIAMDGICDIEGGQKLKDKRRICIRMATKFLNLFCLIENIWLKSNVGREKTLA